MIGEIKSVELGNVCDLLSGFAFKSNEFTSDKNDWFLVKGSNVGHQSIDFDSGPWWKVETLDTKYKKYVLHEDDVILAMDRPIVGGQLKYTWIKKNDPKCLLVQRMARLKGTSKLDVRFLRYVIGGNEFLSYVDSITTGANVPHISGPDIKKFTFSLPCIAAQRRIAQVLSAYDDLIESNLRRIKLLEEMAQITYEEWFVRLRFPGHETTPITPETGLPEGWRMGKMQDLLNFKNGYAFKSDTYIQDGQYKIVTIKNVQDGSFIPETTDTIAELPSNIKPHHHLVMSDIIMSLTGNVGRVCLVYGENYLLNQRVAKIVPNNSKDHLYVYNLLRSRGTLTQLENISNGAAQQNLSPVNASKMSILVPSRNILDAFYENFGAIVDLICLKNIENQRLSEARDILLPRLMNGMIDVENYHPVLLTIEPYQYVGNNIKVEAV